MKFADLHLHTSFSDGTYTPSELVLKSLKAGLDAVAVTDHDTVEGLEETIKLGKDNGLEVLPAIELSSERQGCEIHILGYLLDFRDKDLLDKLNFLKKNRVERAYNIIDKLGGLGLKLNPETVFDLSKGGTVGRLHIARAMLKDKLIKSLSEAFQKYIGDSSPAYVAGFKFSPQEAIALIRKSGGIPVLAHPYTIKDDDLLNELISYGIMGLEAYYPEHSQAQVNFYLNLAQEKSLLVTGGSDCHGKAKPEVRIGSIKIPYSLVDKLKARKLELNEK